VLIDDRPALIVPHPGGDCRGKRVDTIESLGSDGQLLPCSAASTRSLPRNALLPPGFIMASAGLLRKNPNPSDAEILDALGSNICRCTGYVKIIEAVKFAAALGKQGVAP
jgi:aerobic-type carbon monoxide dehydrogenase small subunit (CoxS/CutS family)